MNKEELNPNFDINAKYESMLEVSERIVKDYISKNNDSEPSSEICLAYDVKNYLPILQQENQQLREQLHRASMDIQEMVERDVMCPTNCDKLIKYKSILDEIREYIEKQIREYKYAINEVQMEDYIEDIYYMIIRNFEDALQILDKVKE